MAFFISKSYQFVMREKNFPRTTFSKDPTEVRDPAFYKVCKSNMYLEECSKDGIPLVKVDRTIKPIKYIKFERKK